MSEETFDAHGSCICGKVSYTATVKKGAGACHCGMCRKWSGGPFMAAHAVGSVDFTGAEHISRFSSSQWAERGFCSHCGSNLFYFLLPRPGVPHGEYILSAGSVDEQQQLSFTNEVYVEHAPGWYDFTAAESRTRLTEADIMAMYGGAD
ncbi:MAG: GFA family protein [Pseudomonadota bacterium]